MLARTSALELLALALVLSAADARAQDEGWTCDASYWGDGACDCGCGADDVDCDWAGCAEPGCWDAACEYCDAQPCAAPSGVPEDWSCDESFFGDGACDCGCGAIDGDCGDGGCAEPGCREPSCQYCDDGAGPGPCGDAGQDEDEDEGGGEGEGEGEGEGALAGWSCNASYYGDGECDCGCGLLDLDCGGLGCADPGCWDAACQYCGGAEGLSVCEAPGAPSDGSCGAEYSPCCGAGADGGCASGLTCNELFEEPLCTIVPLEEAPPEAEVVEWTD